MLNKLVLLFICLIISCITFAQLPTLPANLSNITASDVTEEQITQITSYLRNNNITSQQAYDLVIRRGMNQSEATLLKERINKELNLPKVTAESTDNTIKDNKNQIQSTQAPVLNLDSINKTVQVQNPKKIFGLEIFNNGVLTFEPNLKIATPLNYIIGPDDEININIFGYQEAKYTVRVGTEGDINIPYVGVMYVAGLTIEQATEKIKAKLTAAGYSNISTGLTKLAVTLGRIRSIKVTILGEVKKPGSYTLPSLATAFNALYLSGGPTDIGSMRNIQIIRNGKIIERLDIYDFLIKGDQRNNIVLRDQDVIRIPAYDVRVSVEGQVKRTGLFEMKPNETLKELFEFAGGFSDSAYTASITAYRNTDIEKQIVDIDRQDFVNYKPVRSESFVVRKMVGRYVNRVSINGAVYLPGDYQYNPGMTLKDLIKKAQGLKEDVFKPRGLIVRNKPDLTPEYISFSPNEVMQGLHNVNLQPDDRVTVSSVNDVKENSTVTIFGEIRFSGTYPYVSGMTLKDLILLAGGFTDAALPQRIELARRIKSDTFNINDSQMSEVFDINGIHELESGKADIPLKSYDAIVVRKNPGYQAQINVLVSGEVAFPGPYVLKTKNERISDLIKRAGGLTPQAYNQGGYLTRRNNSKTIISELNYQKVYKIQETLKDTTKGARLEVERTVDQIAIDLSKILQNPGGKNDLILEEGDVITIPKEKMDVRISGQVLFPTRVVYDENLNLKDYLGRAGGVANNARKGKIYVLYPNGNAARTRQFLFFRSFPKVTSGSEIIVPKKNEIERRRLSTGEVIGIATAITSFAGVLLSLLLNIGK